MTRAVYGILALLLTALWAACLAAPVLSTRLEMDLWWMMPLMETETHAMRGLDLLGFLLSPAPFLLGQPLLKCHLWLHTSSVGFPISALVALSMGIHALNALGVYGLSRGLGVSRRVGGIAGLIYLTLFAHFHAYLWPTAVQHLIAVGTILALLNSYLRGAHAGTLALMVFSSLQRSALLGPLLMLVHALSGTSSAEERRAGFDRWLPGWLLCGIYPAFALAAVGDPRITFLFFHWPGPVWAKALLLWGAGAGFLLLIRRGIVLWGQHPSWRVPLRGLVILGLTAGVVLLALRDKRQWVFLYNAVVPFSATMVSFLEPIRTALLISPAEPYHWIPPQVSVWSVTLAAALAWFFGAEVPQRRKVLPLLAVWYGVGLIYFLQPNFSFPSRIPSRYFIYLSPIFAVIFSFSFCGFWEALSRRFRIQPFLREALMLGLVTALCVPNLVAIRLALFRGRLTNTYLLYEDLRRADEQNRNGLSFEKEMDQAQQAWERADLAQARISFERAAAIRPFLLRYVLSSYRLEDVRWLTGGMDVRDWVSKTGGLYVSWGEELSGQAAEFQRIAAQLHQELSDYLFCLLSLAYLEEHAGRPEESRRWLSQMGWLEQNGWKLFRWIQEDPRVTMKPSLHEFSTRLEDPRRFGDPLPWRKDDFGFGLFMMRFLTRW